MYIPLLERQLHDEGKEPDAAKTQEMQHWRTIAAGLRKLVSIFNHAGGQAAGVLLTCQPA